MRKNGFTLLEVLVVIVVIGILATLISSAAAIAMRSARAKRVKVSRTILETAIYRYRSEYNEWPGGYDNGWGGEHTFSGENNKLVFGMLRSDSKDNPDRVQFLDETAFFTKASGGEAKKLSETDPSTAQPLVFLSRSGKVLDADGNYHYYAVEINYENETVAVTAPGFDEDEDEED